MAASLGAMVMFRWFRYNALFEYLAKSMKQLRRKCVPWKRLMLDSLEACRSKLDKYYSQIDGAKPHLFENRAQMVFNRFLWYIA